MAPAAKAPPPPIHLLTGEETWLRNRRAAELDRTLRPAEFADYNVDVFQGPDIDLDSVVGACETLPMLADRRLVLLRDLDVPVAASHRRFVEYLSRPNPSTALIITATTTKSRGKTPKALKDFLALIPHVQEFGPLTADRAGRFVQDATRARGMEIAPDAVRLLVDLVGVDAARLESEVEKAVLYASGRSRIEAADVELLAWRTRSHTVFELTDAIAAGDRDGVLRQLHALFEDGHDPIPLTGMVAWHLRRTLRGAALIASGERPREAARKVGVFGAHSEKFAATCGRLGPIGAARALRALQVVDRGLKSSPEDKRQLLERTLVGILT